MGRRSRRSRRHLTALPGSQQNPVPTPTAAASPDHVDSLIAAIAAGELDDELERIAGVISERLAMLRAARSMAVIASLDIGDRVRINHAARPAYLPGAHGIVPGWAGQRVVVRLDQPIGRFVDGEVRGPPTVLDPLGPE